MSWNKVCIIGNLGRDPELRYTPQGTPVCDLSVATTEKFRGQGGDQQEKTIWFRVAVWGKQAEACSKYLAKGRLVYVEGRLSIEEWTDKEGKQRYTAKVNASEVQFLGGGEANSNTDRNDKQYHDQRRKGPDESEQSQALPLGSDEKDDTIPF